MTLRLKNISFGHGSKIVGSNLSLDIRAGEVLALLGANGAGKTTLFKTILGLMPPLSGEILLDGKTLSTLSRREQAIKVAYVPQAHEAAFPFTIRDIVLMGRTAHLGRFDMPGDEDHRIAEEALNDLGITALADRPYTQVSGGERQMALIARALSQQASVIVMDEPASSLDYGNQIRLLSRIREIASKGLSIILSTHNPDHARLVADRVALLHGGALIGIGPPDAVLTAEAIKTLYGVDVEIETSTKNGSTVFVANLRQTYERNGIGSRK
ncbi:MULTISPECIES: ABC transporter ATP-binding protein [Rhizobium/Agrobacterium group]|uniref:ABC transporter ATP-binding protein n=1 Tax=Rhizobium/Agrobacterium group TaxID=227290 RepID=UPI002300BD6A|nr:MULTISPECIES: ABC transporter ATP-binding protein [Rhizobium/Agrobacterium group]MDA5635926.1 ABC transporter ATP-binding protein [Agrobacterium sp. ST15.16.024]MDF1891165.1 ABC transporter ATP-binding protein [Rhizobium rhizogenes]